MKNLFIKWNDKFDSGIPIIDEQHRAMVAMINTHYYFIQNGEGPEVLDHSMNALDYYLRTHLQTEEKLMLQADFPGYENHVTRHEKMKIEKELIAKEMKEHNDPVLLLRFLKEWLIDHLIHEDKKYIPYMQKLM